VERKSGKIKKKKIGGEKLEIQNKTIIALSIIALIAIFIKITIIAVIVFCCIIGIIILWPIKKKPEYCHFEDRGEVPDG